MLCEQSHVVKTWTSALLINAVNCSLITDAVINPQSYPRARKDHGCSYLKCLIILAGNSVQEKSWERAFKPLGVINTSSNCKSDKQLYYWIPHFLGFLDYFRCCCPSLKSIALFFFSSIFSSWWSSCEIGSIQFPHISSNLLRNSGHLRLGRRSLNSAWLRR